MPCTLSLPLEYVTCLPSAANIEKLISSSGSKNVIWYFITYPTFRRLKSACSSLEIQFHVQGSRHGIGTIRANLLKTEPAIHHNRILHRGLNCIEANFLITNVSRFSENCVYQCQSQFHAAKLRTNVQALHFTNVRLKSMKSYTPCGFPIRLSQ